MTFSEDGEQIPISVRVGQAVDVIGQAGKPRTISGFQTHQSPVRLGQTERAELATEEFFSYSHVLEGMSLDLLYEYDLYWLKLGMVIVRKNENFEKEDTKMEESTKR